MYELTGGKWTVRYAVYKFFGGSRDELVAVFDDLDEAIAYLNEHGRYHEEEDGTCWSLIIREWEDGRW